ncbi:MAG: glutamate-1-semialdehyde 2,1-aminomutase [Nitrospinota bacterium]|jgi:glutamate-1-semialdehyde 2,1-aminomutase|nr:glutamate-1-semialdehyde 2,1-aminomutase [Nitrospinota bacterium]MDP7581332.1 glutamate-1-semialdehyde 2,1-aminomutase [Nitrospinota bacterium]HJN03083.1 glutamate-1-semialdehyde 2,1-aminomutase [Nitrospinota bacterium]
MITKSETLFCEAQKFIPGGVNSPVRAFKSVDMSPLFIKKALGSKITDVDDNEYIDYVGSWGPLILGHTHPDVVVALENALSNGTSYGAPTEIETQLAKLVIQAVPSIEIVRMVNSGTEASMSAIRLARGYTGRKKIIKFEGCYHGHVDSLLVKAGSGASTLGIPDSPGITEDLAKLTITLPFNDIEKVKECFQKEGDQIACIILEPIAGNMGVIPPEKGFLEGLKKITEQYKSILIFDEVMTGFRVAFGGAQEFYQITPDLTCLGKIIGGGLPVGAYGGKKEVMNHIAPLGPVYQAGTLSGNPLAMTAGIATLNLISRNGFYEDLDQKAEYLCSELKSLAEEKGLPVYFTRVGSMFSSFFTDNQVKNYEDAKKSNLTMFTKYFQNMLNNGIYLAPSQFEAGFISSAHTREDIDKTLDAARASFKQI